MRTIQLITFFVGSTLLVGCQSGTGNHQGASQLTVGPQQQSQMAAVVAASRFLRDDCQRADIPSDGIIMQRVTGVMDKQGLSVDTAASASLGALQEKRYQSLLQDPLPRAEKCTQINKSMASLNKIIAG